MFEEALVDPDEEIPLPKNGKIWIVITSLVIVSVLGLGWRLHEQSLIDSHEGWGYWVGIVGVALLLPSLLQALVRKAPAPNAPSLSWLGLLGLAGPALIVLHTNFHVERRAALLAMLTMALAALSGLIGRALRTKLKATTGGMTAQASELETSFRDARAAMTEAMKVSPALKNYLEQFEEQELPRYALLLTRYLRVRGLRRRLSGVQQRAMKFLRQLFESRVLEEDWTPEQLQAQLVDHSTSLGTYLTHLCDMAEHDTYSRLFAIWRIQHILLVALMVFAVSTHIYSVHAY